MGPTCKQNGPGKTTKNMSTNHTTRGSIGGENVGKILLQKPNISTQKVGIFVNRYGRRKKRKVKSKKKVLIRRFRFLK